MTYLAWSLAVFAAAVAVTVLLRWDRPRHATYPLPGGDIECLEWDGGSSRACWDPLHQPVWMQ